MFEYDAVCLNTFLEKQSQLFRENVAETPEEAEEFLSDCMAIVCDSLEEVQEYFEEQGMDIEGMTLADFAEASEVFELPDGRYLVVEG